MAKELHHPSVDLWLQITRTVTKYATDNPREIHDLTYQQVMRFARKTAEQTDRPVRVAAFYFDIWYLVDVAYPASYAQ